MIEAVRTAAAEERAVAKRHTSRSAFIRESVAQTLSALRMQELVESERRAYARRPETADERATFRALAGAQDRVVAGLGKKDRW